MLIQPLYGRRRKADAPGRRERSAPRHGGHDREGLPVGDGRGQAVEEAHVLVGQEDVDEAAQARALVEEPVGEARVGGIEGLEGLADRRPLDLDLARAAREGAQLGGDADGQAPRAASSASGSKSMAASKAASVGAIVAVGADRAAPVNASTVLRP